MACAWENWTISFENESHLSELLSTLQPTGVSTPSLWWKLYNYKHSPKIDLCGDQIETKHNELNNEEIIIINLLRESLSSNICLQENSFAGIPYNSFSKIFSTISLEMDEAKFSMFCEFISSWHNEFLIEQALKVIVLPKLQERKESTACTVFSLTKLAGSKPSQFCEIVLTALLTDQILHFTDVELFKSIYEVLPVPQKDIVILTLVKKEEFEETDWLLLQMLVKYLSSYSVINVIDCVQKWSGKFSKSQVFGKFLVSLCKYSHGIGQTELLLSVVEKHETLFKRQAKKFLQ